MRIAMRCLRMRLITIARRCRGVVWPGEVDTWLVLEVLEANGWWSRAVATV